VAGPIVIASTGLGTGPSDTCLRSPELANARALATCQTRLTPKSRRLTNYRKLQEMLNEICAINAELLRRRESLD
jgi:hypothetical protein